MSYFTRTFDGDMRHSNVKVNSRGEPPKLNPLASCFKPRATRIAAEVTTRQNAPEKVQGSRATDKIVAFHTQNPGESSGLVAYVNQRFCSVTRRDAQLLELLAPGPPLPAHLQPACSYCHRRSPKICWHPFKDNLGRIICPLIGYKLAVLETYRKKHPSYQAIRSLHRRLLANGRRSSSSSGQVYHDARLKITSPDIQSGLEPLLSEENAKLKRKYLKYEAERQSHEADYLRKLQECEKIYNNKSTGEVLSYMPVSERIASRSLRSHGKLTSSARLDSKNKHSSKGVKATKGVKSCITSNPLGEEVLSLYSDGNYNEKEKFPSNMNAYVERVLAHDDSCLSHITGSSNLSGSSSSHQGNASGSSGQMKGFGYDLLAFARDNSPESLKRPSHVFQSFLQTENGSSSTEGSFIFSIAERLDKAEDLNFDVKNHSLSYVLDAFQTHLETIIQNEEISFRGYGRLMGSILERCAMRRAAINECLASNFFNEYDDQLDLVSYALAITRALPQSKLSLRRHNYWKDLEYIYFTAVTPEGKVNEEVRVNLLNEVDDIVSSSISNVSGITASSGPARNHLNVNGSLGYTSENQTSSYGSDPSSYSDTISECDTNPIFEAAGAHRKLEVNFAESWQSNYRADFPMEQTSRLATSKLAAWANYSDSTEHRLDNEYASNFYGQTGQNHFLATNELQAYTTEYPSLYEYPSTGPSLTSPELHPEPLRSCLDFRTALMVLKLLDYFLDNFVIFMKFFSEVKRNVGQESAYDECLEKAIEKLDSMTDKSKDGIKSEVEWMKPNFEKVNKISAIWSSYKVRDCYSLW